MFIPLLVINMYVLRLVVETHINVCVNCYYATALKMRPPLKSFKGLIMLPAVGLTVLTHIPLVGYLVSLLLPLNFPTTTTIIIIYTISPPPYSHCNITHFALIYIYSCT